jgi:tRNA A37 threonylcarbamoyladenosine biosynthesis protein TsaE
MDGDLGAGKTCLSRGFIRARTGISDERVTSPTYLLSNTYDAGDSKYVKSAWLDRMSVKNKRRVNDSKLICDSFFHSIHHMDLYRLTGKEEELVPLNIEYVLENCKCSTTVVYVKSRGPTSRVETILNVCNTGICLVEWPSRLGSFKPAKRLDLTIRIDETARDIDEEDSIARILTLQPHGERWEERLRLIQDEGYLDDLILEDEVVR